MGKTVSIVLIAVGILILILLISSFSYQLGKAKVKVAPTPEITLLEKSKVIRSQRASARGQVTEINLAERILTLTSEEESLGIPIKKEASIIALTISKEKAEPETKEIELKDIKIGDRVVVQIEILAGGKFKGESVTVLPVISP